MKKTGESVKKHFSVKIITGIAVALTGISLAVTGITGTSIVNAKSDDNVILEGIYMGNVELSGQSVEQAYESVNSYVDSLKQRVVTFGAVDDHYVAVTVGDLGLCWVNQEDIETAATLGKKGNIVKRYKAIQDLKHGNKVFELKLDIDKDALREVLDTQCTEYDLPAVNATMTRENGEFVVSDGQTGQAVNVEESLEKTYKFITEGWDGKDASIDLVIDVTQPKGNAEELKSLTNVLGQYKTSFTTSSSSRCKNIENACKLINGTLLYPGEEFSTLATIVPFTTENGYFPAGSYLNGKVVESIGGGICQVSTTLYNAVLLSELEVTERSNHSMIISYVDPSMDAAIAESAGKDFKFRNNLDKPIYIYGYTEGKTITFMIYGVETRPASHKVRYESETLSVTKPEKDILVANSGLPIGKFNVESAHIGYKAQLWKIVEEDGAEVSREVINKSTYKVSPRTATVGIASDNPAYVARMQAAVATGSLDACKAEAAAINAEISAVQNQQAALEAYYAELLRQQQQQQQQAAQ